MFYLLLFMDNLGRLYKGSLLGLPPNLHFHLVNLATTKKKKENPKPLYIIIKKYNKTPG